MPCSEDTPLTLEYGGTSQTFTTPEQLSSYILGEFRAAQKNTGEGSELEDMTIYYPSDEYTGYEVIDTPGPNFAGAGTKHYEIARKCIQEADICIFVMNYSNHLTHDEQKFLEEIRTVFAEQGKFYSLFVAVNRIDERYASEVEKSVCRLVDYIRSRLEGLGYRNIILFGTSALQSFYLDKTSDFMRELNICPQNNEPLTPELETLFDDYPKQAKKHTTELAFMETALRNLKHFHGVKKPTASDIKIFSGIPQLEQHLKYIGESKVDNEIVYNVIMRCEGYFSAIRNALLVTRLLELSEQDKDALTELDKLMGDFTRRVQEIIASLQKAADSGIRNTVLLELARASESNRDEILGLVEETCRLTIRNIHITEEDISSAKDGRITGSLRAINSAVKEAAADLSVRYTKAVIATSESVNSYHSREVEKLLRNAREKVLEEFARVKSRLNNDAALSLINEFRIPEFPPSLNKLDFTAGSFDASGIDEQFFMSAAESSHTRVSEIKYRKESRRERRSARGFWEKVKAFFGAEYYEYRDVQIPYEEFRDVYDADRFRRTIAAILEKNVRRSVVNVIKEVNRAAEHDAEEIFSDISRQCEEINAQYMENFRTLSNDIQTAIDTTGKHRLSLLGDIDALKKIADDLSAFFSMWDEVLGGGR
ncbi:MAG: dynamin family protein [Synergistaceae bacterium]|nr:dynamin family protein [Synergistaceae bacterium]